MNSIKNIVVTNIQEVGKILDYVHDRRFQLSHIKVDKEKATLTIPLTVVSDIPIDRKNFLFLKTWKNPVVESELIIKNIINYAIKDEAQVGEADINIITKENNSILIKCGLPVEIKVKVTSVEIELIMSDKVVDKISFFSFSSSPKEN